METLLKVKQSNVPIENKDQLCCECTIVTMRNRLPIDENVDGKRMYENLRKGLPVQETQSRELHQFAVWTKVSELEKFQKVLNPKYQIQVLSVSKPHMIIFKGPSAFKKILLVHVIGHYHGCDLFGGFLNKSHYVTNVIKNQSR